MNEGHTFIAIELPRAVLAAVEGVGRQVAAAAKQAGGRAEPISRRLLVLPLDDLGAVPPEALEAVELAVERACAAHAPFSVHLGAVEAAPEATPSVARLRVEDDDGHLAALRADLHRRLARYGFPVGEGAWRPHVPLARVHDLDALPTVTPPGRLGLVRVQRLIVFRRDPLAARGARFRVASHRMLGQASRASEPPEAEAHRAEIAAELDARLSRRAEMLGDESTHANRARRRRRAS